MLTNEQLVGMANSFSPDPLFEATVERRSKNTWALCYWSRCLDKVTGEWDYESSPSNRTEGFISSTRFASLNEAIEHYAQWRKERFFIFCKSKSDYHWNCFVYGKDENEVRNSWAGFAKDEVGKRKRHGVWVLVGPDFKILDKFVAEDGSAEGVEFVDQIAELYK